MIKVRNAEQRGHTKTDWLDSRHSFSFGDYSDPNWTEFGPLRVLNEDLVAPQSGFQPHGHKDMEIFTYVISGALSHQDSTGKKSTLQQGSIQLMSAGTGIEHSEMNDQKDASVHFIQVWIKPAKTGIKPAYQEKKLKPGDWMNNIFLLASPDGQNDSLKINQDAYIYASSVEAGRSIAVSVEPDRRVYAHIIGGSCYLNNEELSLGDGAAITDEEKISIDATDSTVDVLLFDLSK